MSEIRDLIGKSIDIYWEEYEDMPGISNSGMSNEIIVGNRIFAKQETYFMSTYNPEDPESFLLEDPTFFSARIGKKGFSNYGAERLYEILKSKEENYPRFFSAQMAEQVECLLRFIQDPSAEKKVARIKVALLKRLQKEMRSDRIKRNIDNNSKKMKMVIRLKEELGR